MNLKMCSVYLIGVAALATSVSGARADVPAIEHVEVLIGNVFVPEVGYEDKNNIDVTLDGLLPDSCYQLGDTEIEQGSDPFSITVHQFADRRTDGVCSDVGNLPPSMKALVPYTKNYSLGHLPAGNYRLLFNLGTGPKRISPFNVAVAHTMQVDDFPYASVSAANIADIVNGVYPVHAAVVGTLANSCQFIKEVKLLPEPRSHVVVVLPIVGFKEGQLCAQVILPFEYPVDIGKLDEGRYLLHVRSRNGQAITRVFSVVKPDPSGSRH